MIVGRDPAVSTRNRSYNKWNHTSIHEKARIGWTGDKGDQKMLIKLDISGETGLSRNQVSTNP